MALTIVTEPAIEPLDLEEIEDHLRLSETSTGAEDTLLLTFQTVARRYCERIQNRAYLHQTLRLTLDAFPRGDCIVLPRPPLVSISSITYYGTGGTANAMTASAYYADTAGEPGRVCLAYGETWPHATLRPTNGVEVQYVAGYGSVQSVVPAEVRQAIKLIVGHMYEHREGSDVKSMTPSWIKESFMGVDSLLSIDRVWPI